MPASPSGFGNFLLERNISMATAGYQLLGCPSGVQPPAQHQQPAPPHPMVPMAYSGLQGYNFIPYPHHRHMAHMNNTFDLKAASPYHHALLARGGAPFYPQYRTGTTEDPSRVAKVATRESTSALKAWLNEHLKNPYPTKGEKIMLAIITKMSLTQVSTWFANARRRLKKENRVSWASKGKSDEEDEAQDSEDEDESSLQKSRLDDEEDEIDPQSLDGVDMRDDAGDSVVCSKMGARLEIPQQHQQHSEASDNDLALAIKTEREGLEEHSPSDLKPKDDTASQKPKIWSLAETATSEIVKKPIENNYHPTNTEVSRLWADWASRNGLYIPTSYNMHELL